MKKFVAEWKDYWLSAEGEAEDWTAKVRHAYNQKWAWEEAADSEQEAKADAVATAIQDARLSTDDAVKARAEITWKEVKP